MVDQQLSAELLTSGEINTKYPVEGRDEGQGYLSSKNSDAKFGVVVLQEWWGLNKSICKTADRYAELGFRAFVPDVYRGKCADSREKAGHLMNGLDWAGAVQDIRGAVLYLKANGCTKVGVLGFCMGGALTVVSLVNIPEIDCGLPFYGVPGFDGLKFEQIKVPVYAYFGQDDPMKGFSSPEDAVRLEKALKDAGVNITLKIIPGAGHAFMNQDSPNHKPDIYKWVIQENAKWLKSVFEAKL